MKSQFPDVSSYSQMMEETIVKSKMKSSDIVSDNSLDKASDFASEEFSDESTNLNEAEIPLDDLVTGVEFT